MMADAGRSRRNRKVIDYASLGDGDESDDDFVSSATPPVAKKPKLDKPEKSSKLKTKKEKPEKENAKKEKKSLNRKPPGEQAFDEELQAALELSLIETSTYGTESQESEIKTVETTAIIDVSNDEIVCLGSEPIKSASPEKSSRRAASKAVEQRKAFLESEDSEGPSQERKEDDANEDDDFKVEDDESEEDEEDMSEDSFSPEDDDSDFDDGKKKKKGKEAKKPPAKPKVEKAPKPAKPVTKKPAKGAGATPRNIKSTPNKPTPKASPAPFRSPLATSSLPATNTPKSGVGTSVGRKQAWTPPTPVASSGKSVNLGGIGIKSPNGVGGGGLRLGLSRSQRVKPLHSSVKVPR